MRLILMAAILMPPAVTVVPPAVSVMPLAGSVMPLAVSVMPLAWAQTTQPVRHADPATDALLDAIERRGDSIRTLRSAVAYITQEEKLNTVSNRRGQLWVSRPAGEPNKTRFKVHFNVLILDNQQFPEDEYYAFDGEVLTQRKDATRTITRERLVQPGEQADPFKLDGPFPLPFGEDKVSLLKHFEITRTPPKSVVVSDAALKAAARKLPGVAQTEVLWLVPKPDSELSQSLRYLMMMVDAQSHLPVQVVSAEGQDVLKIAIFRDTMLNGPVSEEELTVTAPPGFAVSEEPAE